MLVVLPHQKRHKYVPKNLQCFGLNYLMFQIPDQPQMAGDTLGRHHENDVNRLHFG